MSPTIIVTGARGFLGRYTARRLALDGFSVTGVGYGSWEPQDYGLWGLSNWNEGEITLETLCRSSETPYAIVHCAGGASVPASLQNPPADFERTVRTTANVMDFVRRCSPLTKVVYPSSASIYGNADHLPIAECASPMPVSPYGIHKWLAEQVIAMYSRQFHIASAILRFFSLYGSGLRKQLLWDACIKMTAGDPTFMGTGKELRDWLHVEDAARLIALGIGNAAPECPIVNGGSGIGVSVCDILTKLSVHLRPGQSAPGFSGSVRGGDPTSFVADTRRSKAWGFVPERSLEDGISDYVEWWRCESLSGLPGGDRAQMLRESCLS